MAGFLKKLFGGGDNDNGAPSSKSPDEVHKDVEIRAAPVNEGGQWRVAGTLTKQIDGEAVSRRFVRADLLQSEADAISACVAKARLIIDQNGDSLWKGDTSGPV